MKFRPCIDLHNGVVKQIVGSSISNEKKDDLKTNFIATKPSEWFASLYKNDNLNGGHIIQLGSGNVEAASKALEEWPGGMQIGGGVNIDNAGFWIDKGADKIIVTSHVFYDGIIDEKRLKALSELVGKERLVLDLSCRKKEGKYFVVTNLWEKFTREQVDYRLLDYLSDYCSEYLIHAVDVEGKISGIEEELVKYLGGWGQLPLTYAGGISSFSDIELINDLGSGAIDFTIGSALDIFGGKGLKYEDVVKKYS